MFKKIVQSLMVLTLAGGVIASSSDGAEARHGRFAAGVAAGIIGLGVLGALADRRYHDDDYDRAGGCYPGPEQCGWVNRRCFENRWGDYVCRGGRWTCWRPTYCD